MNGWRFFEWLAPEETALRRVLPLTMLLRPLPLAALLVLAMNDHVLKGGGLLPSWLVGKLSDFAGLLFFPLLLVTLWNLVCEGVNTLIGRTRLLASPTSTQLVTACILTGVGFSAVQIHPAVADVYRQVTHSVVSLVGASARVTSDPTDLLALPSLLVTFWVGQRAIARVPPGRLPWLSWRLARLQDSEQRAEVLVRGLLDVRMAQPPSRRALVDELARELEREASPHTVDAILARLRQAPSER